MAYLSIEQRVELIRQGREALKRNMELVEQISRKTGASQNRDLNEMEDNNRLIERGDEELQSLASDNSLILMKEVYRATDDPVKRVYLVREGEERIQDALRSYDFDDIHDLARLMRDINETIIKMGCN